LHGSPHFRQFAAQLLEGSLHFVNAAFDIGAAAAESAHAAEGAARTGTGAARESAAAKSTCSRTWAGAAESTASSATEAACARGFTGNRGCARRGSGSRVGRSAATDGGSRCRAAFDLRKPRFHPLQLLVHSAHRLTDPIGFFGLLRIDIAGRRRRCLNRSRRGRGRRRDRRLFRFILCPTWREGQ
jgi:hypothetical protein